MFSPSVVPTPSWSSGEPSYVFFICFCKFTKAIFTFLFLNTNYISFMLHETCICPEAG